MTGRRVAAEFRPSQFWLQPVSSTYPLASFPRLPIHFAAPGAGQTSNVDSNLVTVRNCRCLTHSATPLLEQLRGVAPVHVATRAGRFQLQLCDQRAEPRREDDQVARSRQRFVCVRNSRGHEDG